VIIKKIAIIGAGVMGSDIALDLSSHNYQVILKDLNGEILQKAKEKIEKDLKLMKMLKPELVPVKFEELISRVQLTSNYDGFEAADLIIENITEDYDCKKEVYLDLIGKCKEDAVFGVNTSCISITKIGALLPKPGNVIGMHFMNPVPIKKLVEVIRGYHTSDDTIEKIKDFLKTINKTCTIVNDFPGFITNRVMMPMINECVWAIQDNVAGAKDIDKIFRLGFSHEMGPLATADLIGLDTILNSLMMLYESYNDSKYRPCPLLKKMVDAGLLGKKSGEGFFKYTSGDVK
jgi:3-hydroxybutyryl-CoA dehydrogenase